MYHYRIFLKKLKNRLTDEDFWNSYFYLVDFIKNEKQIHLLDEKLAFLKKKAIEKEKLKIKYVKIPGDSVFIEGACVPDTLKILVPTTVTEVVHAEKPWMNKWWIWLLVGFAVGIILALWLRR